MINTSNHLKARSLANYSSLNAIISKLKTPQDKQLKPALQNLAAHFSSSNSNTLADAVIEIGRDGDLKLLSSYLPIAASWLPRSQLNQATKQIAELVIGTFLDREIEKIEAVILYGLKARSIETATNACANAQQQATQLLNKAKLFTEKIDQESGQPSGFEQVSISRLLESRLARRPISCAEYSPLRGSELQHKLYRLAQSLLSADVILKIAKKRDELGLDFSQVGEIILSNEAIGNLLSPIVKVGVDFQNYELKHGIARGELNELPHGNTITRGTSRLIDMAKSDGYLVLSEPFRSGTPETIIDKINEQMLSFLRYTTSTTELLLSLVGEPRTELIVDTTSPTESAQIKIAARNPSDLSYQVAKLTELISWLYNRPCRLQFVNFGMKLRIIKAKLLKS